MKGLILAGGNGTRLGHLSRVTNKHLLPVYDRPMIFHPIDTLRGMGIREVMVILGGRSIGDIVELLNDGNEFGVDLTYRYQRGALGIAHAIGLARDFVGDDSFVVVLGDNILRGEPLAGVCADFDGGEWGAGTLFYRVPDPERFGVAEFDAGRQPGGLRGEAAHAQEQPDPDRRLFPAARMRSTSSRASRRLVGASSRSPTFSTTTSPMGACSGANTPATGPTRARSSRSSPPAWWPRRTAHEDPRHRRRGLHRLRLCKPAPRAARGTKSSSSTS